jgi:hypothetical protein
VELNRAIAAETSSAVPAGLDALEHAERRFTQVVDASKDGVERSVAAWLAE